MTYTPPYHTYVCYVHNTTTYTCIHTTYTWIWYVVVPMYHTTPLYVYVSIYTSHVMCIDIHIHGICVCMYTSIICTEHSTQVVLHTLRIYAIYVYSVYSTL